MKYVKMINQIGIQHTADHIYIEIAARLELFGVAFFGHKDPKGRRRLSYVWNRILAEKAKHKSMKLVILNP